MEPDHDHVVGNVKLIEDNRIVLVPTPTDDPDDPLNLPEWRKWALLVLVSAYSCTAVVLVSGLGPIFSIIQANYPGQEARVNDLMTYPSLFMGIGNLLCMPLALTVGRRPIFLLSIVILVIASIWCTFSQSLDSHIAARDVMGLAAGQSEALAPMMIHEIYFLHQRGRKIAWFIFIENIACGVFFIVSTYMVSAWGWRWWYGFFAICNFVILLLAIPFVSETSFPRSPEAMRGEPIQQIAVTGKDDGNDADVLHQETVSIATGPTPRRKWRDDLKLFKVEPRWNKIPTFYKHVLQGLCVPSIFWLLLLNGAFLGVYIFQSATFANLLLAPPYAFSFKTLGYVQAGQIVVCFIFLPLLGYGSDLVIRIMTSRNQGEYKPEYRLLVLALPSIAGIVSMIIYGRAGSYPDKWHWSAVVVPYHGAFFGFLGANIVGITYAIDSFPLRSASLLVVICAGRGLIGFALSYSVLPSIAAIGYHGSMNVDAIVCAVLVMIAVPMYFIGPWTRSFAQKRFRMDQEE